MVENHYDRKEITYSNLLFVGVQQLPEDATKEQKAGDGQEE